MKLLEGKVAIVTGAAAVLEKLIALKLASEGCSHCIYRFNIDEKIKYPRD